MRQFSLVTDNEQPESLLQRLVARLSRHLLWDALLIFVPPNAALIFCVGALFWSSWLNPLPALFALALALGATLLAVWLRLRPGRPSITAAARLVDRRTGAQDHFLTLATVDRANEPAQLLTRLRQQASGYRLQIELRRDFPYHFRRSAFWSAGISLFAILLLYFFLPAVQSARPPLNLSRQLREAARELAKNPNFNSLARELEAVAAKLDDPNTPAKEKQALMQQLEQKITEQQKKEEQKENRDSLGQTAQALSGAEKQESSASGQEQKKDQKSGGGLQTNAQQQGQGESKQSQGGAGEGKGESKAQSSKDIDQGQSAPGDSKAPGKDKNRQGDGKENQPDPNHPGKDSQEKAGKTEGGSKEGAGKEQKAAEAPPQSGPLAERFYRPGEGHTGMKGAGYVTVQLPEDVIADAKGETRAIKDSKNNRNKTQIPVSNIPLPAHVPNAAAEKQPLPIEYRGIIR
jgi:hypothetical protein